MSQYLIIGAGVVGRAIAEAFPQECEIVSAREVLDTEGACLKTLGDIDTIIFAQGSPINEQLNFKSLQRIYRSRTRGLDSVRRQVACRRALLMSSSIANLNSGDRINSKLPRASKIQLNLQGYYERYFRKAYPKQTNRIVRLGTLTTSGSQFSEAANRARSTLLFKRIRMPEPIAFAASGYEELRAGIEGFGPAYKRHDYNKMLDEMFGCRGLINVPLKTYAGFLELQACPSLFLWEGHAFAERIGASSSHSNIHFLQPERSSNA